MFDNLFENSEDEEAPPGDDEDRSESSNIDQEIQDALDDVENQAHPLDDPDPESNESDIIP